MPPHGHWLIGAILLTSVPAAAAGPAFETRTICRTAIAAVDGP